MLRTAAAGFTVESADGTGTAVYDRVVGIRERVYGDEFDHPRGLLRDGYDAYSAHFVCAAGGEDVGVVRLTRGDGGPLEVEGQHPEWRAAVGECRRGGLVCECGRLMLVPEARGRAGRFHLAVAAADRMLALGCRRGFLAGKVGGLCRLYRMLGATSADSTPRPFWFGEKVIGEYHLMSFDPAVVRANAARQL